MGIIDFTLDIMTRDAKLVFDKEVIERAEDIVIGGPLERVKCALFIHECVDKYAGADMTLQEYFDCVAKFYVFAPPKQGMVTLSEERASQSAGERSTASQPPRQRVLHKSLLPRKRERIPSPVKAKPMPKPVVIDVTEPASPSTRGSATMRKE